MLHLLALSTVLLLCLIAVLLAFGDFLNRRIVGSYQREDRKIPLGFVLAARRLNLVVGGMKGTM